MTAENVDNPVGQEQDTTRTVPKLLIPKSLLVQSSKQQLGLTQHKRKMVTGIMKRLSIGESDEVRPEFASKVFRKRANSSGQAGDLRSKIQVIDNHESVPGALPTPVVRGSCSTSVFKSEACDTALRKYQSWSGNTSQTSCVEPTKSAEALPDLESSGPPPAGQFEDLYGQPRPIVKTPPLHEFFRKPRTVAEKRIFLLQSPIEYKVLDFENTVYHLIKKLDRFNTDETFRTQVELLMFGDVPINRNIWKAVLWLNSVCNNYRPWYINLDGERVRLFGASGSVSLNEEEIISSKVDPATTQLKHLVKSRASQDGKQAQFLLNKREILEHLHQLVANSVKHKLNTHPRTLIKSKRSAALASLKPGPLSAKVRRLQEVESDSQLGPLEIYDLPPKKFSAAPRLNKPIPRHVSSYLKLAVPDEEMNKDWLNFSLSILQTNTESPEESSKVDETVAPEFHFSVPYKNAQKKILVRRKLNCANGRSSQRINNYDAEMQYQLSFPAVAKTKIAEDEPQIPAELVDEVEGILTEMIDSVAMSFSEDFFIHDDPDLNYQLEMPVKRMQKNYTGSKQSDTMSNSVSYRKMATLKHEMKKLNVTIIDTAKMAPQGE